MANESGRRKEKEDKFCSHQYSDEDAKQSCLRFLTESECDYCGKIINWGGNHPKPSQTMTRPVLNCLMKKHFRECYKAKKFVSEIDAKKVNNLNYDNKETLKKKGWQDIDEIEHWWLEGRVVLPDLKEGKKIGVAKELLVSSKVKGINFPNQKEKRNSGKVFEELVFLTPRSIPINHKNFSEIFKDQKPDSLFFRYGGNKKTTLYEKIVASFLVWRVLKKEKEWNHNIFFSLINLPKFVPIGGESGTLSFYLSLLSVHHQKPISQEVAATGFLDIGNYSQINCPWCFQEEIKKSPEESFSKHKISAVGGLEYKIPAAVAVGVKKLILSTEQKEEYEKNIPQEVKEKLKVYYVKNAEELEKLFWQGEFS